MVGMMEVLLSKGKPPVPLWIDVTNPSPEELFGLAENYQLHPALVQDCLEPNHLPKHELHGDTTFLIVRLYDEGCGQREDSVQAMTRKLALFLGENFFISIHRRDSTLIQQIAAKHTKDKTPVFLQVLLLEILMAAVETYHRPLEQMEVMLHEFETNILKNKEGMENWEEVFRTKCKLTTIKRILWHTLNTVQKFIPFSEANLPLRQDLRERIENLQFFVDGLLDDLNSLLNIQLSLATHRATETSNKTNEILKVLAVFSAFFLPLSFIVGIYGMNFENMPELKHPHGYFWIWGVLVSTFVGIYVWFVRKGWIRFGHLS